MIIQGSNQPIILNIGKEASDISKLSCLLYSATSNLKHWELDDVTISEGKLTLPLEESETLEFPSGKAILEVKWLEDGNIEFAKKLNIQVSKRMDTTQLIEVEDE